jgi:small subunit ribosomal protein S1
MWNTLNNYTLGEPTWTELEVRLSGTPDHYYQIEAHESAKLKKGARVTCEVVAVKDGGLEVKLPDHDLITGFIRSSDLSGDPSEQRPDRFGVGEMFDAVLTQVDTKAREVSVSIKALEIAEEEEELFDEFEHDRKAALAVKINRLA